MCRTLSANDVMDAAILAADDVLGAGWVDPARMRRARRLAARAGVRLEDLMEALLD